VAHGQKPAARVGGPRGVSAPVAGPPNGPARSSPEGGRQSKDHLRLRDGSCRGVCPRPRTRSASGWTNIRCRNEDLRHGLRPHALHRRVGNQVDGLSSTPFFPAGEQPRAGMNGRTVAVAWNQRPGHRAQTPGVRVQPLDSQSRPTGPHQGSAHARKVAAPGAKREVRGGVGRAGARRKPPPAGPAGYPETSPCRPPGRGDPRHPVGPGRRRQ